ncbi:MAG: hypothetical protein R6X17_00805 [Candidatus Competibacteraceae bacterium]
MNAPPGGSAVGQVRRDRPGHRLELRGQVHWEGNLDQLRAVVLQT